MTKKENRVKRIIHRIVYAHILRTHSIVTTAMLVLCALLLVTDASAQTVLKRARLGNNTEDMEFIKSGRYANRIAILDGYEVLSLPAKGQGHGGVQKLFNLNRLPIIIRPTGMAYVESER